MPTTLTHAVIGAAGAAVLPVRVGRGRLCLAGVICAALPDIDVLAFRIGLPHGHVLGHRGLSHSILFAAAVSIAVTCLLLPKIKPLSRGWWSLAGVFFIIGLSHGVLDAMTNGGSGCAFFAPFDNSRIFMPWRPLPVSPIGFSTRLLKRRIYVLAHEMVMIWLPLIIMMLTVHTGRYVFKKRVLES